MKSFLHNLGLDHLTAHDMEKICAYAMEHGMAFRGYEKKYHYACFGNSEISFRMSPTAWEGNTPTEFTPCGYDVSFRSRTCWDGEVMGRLELSDDPDACCIEMMPDADKAWRVPVTLMHPDVLPSLSPGDTMMAELSGLALNVGRRQNLTFSVDRGPFYEMELARFLEDNPGKTPDDFKAPSISTEGFCGTFPTGSTCFWQISAPVQEVEVVEFAGKSFLRILMPIARTADEEDMLAYIYADKEKYGDLALAPGDDIDCHVWLCADLCRA